MAIDTLAYTKHLEAAGVDRKTAEAHATGMARHIVPDLATKADLQAAVTDLKLWLIVAMVGVAGLAITIAKLF